MANSKTPEQLAIAAILPMIDQELVNAPIHKRTIDITIPRTIANVATFRAKAVMQKIIKSLLIRGFTVIGARLSTLTIRIELPVIS